VVREGLPSGECHEKQYQEGPLQERKRMFIVEGDLRFNFEVRAPQVFNQDIITSYF
jgi:hypothetical protein